jgi:hypothetical protein
VCHIGRLLLCFNRLVQHGCRCAACCELAGGANAWWRRVREPYSLEKLSLNLARSMSLGQLSARRLLSSDAMMAWSLTSLWPLPAWGVLQDAGRRCTAQVAVRSETTNRSYVEDDGGIRRVSAMRATAAMGSAEASAPSLGAAYATAGRRRLDLASIPMLDTRQSCQPLQSDQSSTPSHWQDVLSLAESARPALLDGHGCAACCHLFPVAACCHNLSHGS